MSKAAWAEECPFPVCDEIDIGVQQTSAFRPNLPPSGSTRCQLVTACPGPDGPLWQSFRRPSPILSRILRCRLILRSMGWTMPPVNRVQLTTPPHGNPPQLVDW